MALGKTYFELARAIYRATRFSDIVAALTERLPGLIGVDEVVLLELSPISGPRVVVQHGPVGNRLAKQLKKRNEIVARFPTPDGGLFQGLGDLSVSSGELRPSSAGPVSGLLREILDLEPRMDHLACTVVSGSRRQAVLVCYSRPGAISEENRERLDGLLWTLRSVLDRLEAHNVEMMVRHRVFVASAQLAVFFMNQRSEIHPLNHAAVRFAEGRWTPDEASKLLTLAQREMVDRETDLAWIDPITASWRELQLDLGAGTMTVHALPKLSGEIILMLPVAREESAEDVVVPILTQRQREIMDWIAEGKTSAEAAIILGISPRTVEKHLEAIFQRLGVENRIGAMRRYLDLKRGA